MTLTQMLLIVCPLIFFASFIDSIAGGGGLISLPAYMLTGLPMHTVCGCNKFSAAWGTGASALRYYRSGKMQLKGALVSAVLALAGAGVGVSINMWLDSDTLKKVFLVVLPVVAVVVLFGEFGKRKKMEPLTGMRFHIACAVIGFIIGIYDGLIGPGTGTFLVFAYTRFCGCDYVTASGNARMANLASNVTSMIAYLMAGQVLFALAIPAAVCGIAGGILGSNLAIKKGAGFVRTLMLIVMGAIFVKLIWDMFH